MNGENGPAGMEAPAADLQEDGGPIGIFPSWPALYTTVVIYATTLIVIFAILSAVLDFSG